jgi:hypothetical protein
MAAVRRNGCDCVSDMRKQRNESCEVSMEGKNRVSRDDVKRHLTVEKASADTTSSIRDLQAGPSPTSKPPLRGHKLAIKIRTSHSSYLL